VLLLYSDLLLQPMHSMLLQQHLGQKFVFQSTSWTEICISVQTYRAYSPVVLAKMKMFVICISVQAYRAYSQVFVLVRCILLSKHIEYAVYFCPSISSMFAVYSCAP